jgi:hypothetical protein
VRDVHPVTDDEQIRADEADMIGRERLRELARFVEEHGDGNLPRPPFLQELLRECDGAARLQNIVDDEDIAARNVALDVTQELHFSRRSRSGPVAGQRQELDLRRKARAMERTQEVGSEHKAALEYRDDEQIAIAGGSDLRGEFDVAFGDCLGAEQDAQRPTPDLRHQALSSIRAVRSRAR